MTFTTDQDDGKPALNSTEPSVGPNLVASSPAAAPTRASLPIWMNRAMLVIWVVFCVELGLFLAVLPWLTIWTSNALVITRPALHEFLGYDFVRGAVSGLGLLNVFIGIWDAAHYRDKT